ncbi:thiamine pyrophosphate-dependent enzyme [Lamprobacter modestohalophilus]|uniref:thiamine pyrophosphate-dependent enzyme n=1 Tax=Lamprobacter modestohalophilus TaxID=1064514 RepID=UPI002ADED202|nr:thiamine pyrophosphate-dependent enzyme [Lamprobacter modestohalophilus]MEA1049125.1 thiamine pyrophosphate-dependent enzyme [Lamprobacter modestohalophilus]
MTEERLLLSGDDAVALAALHAGVRLGTGYPGTPSTEILETFDRLGGHAQWAPNEKVALEVGIGSAFAGARTLVTMKHVGLNVAADALFTATYTDVDGGLVIISADDPGMASSQNEQDNRHFARAAGAPMLEPIDSQQAYDYTWLALEIGERWKIPVILRLTTRVCHAKTVVRPRGVEQRRSLEDPETPPENGKTEHRFRRDIPARVMIPAFAKPAHHRLRQKLAEIAAWNEAEGPMQEYGSEARDQGGDHPGEQGGRLGRAPIGHQAAGAIGNQTGLDAGKQAEAQPDKQAAADVLDPPKLGIIATGVAAIHAREAAPKARQLTFGLTYPLPLARIRAFANQVERLLVIEEGDPVLVDDLNAAGIKAEGKPMRYRFGELNVERVRRIIAGDDSPEPEPAKGKPPELCQGCSHRTVFEALRDLNCIVAGDIGCYTLGVLPPFSAMDTCVCMGASIGVGLGMRHVLPEAEARRVVSVIGDSTFVHSGLTGLAEMVYNPPPTGHLVLILDNGTTAMTGQQEHPGTGRSLDHSPTHQLDFAGIGQAMGVQSVVLVDGSDKSVSLEERIATQLARNETALFIVRQPCVLAAPKIRLYEKAAAGERERQCAALPEI